VPEDLSVVVPVYNGASTLEALTERLGAVLDPIREYEIVFVNDGSRDESWSEIARLSESRPQVRGIDLMRNYGQHNALLAGVRSARNPVVVTRDDDLQNPPEEIPKLLGKLDEGFDVVYGASSGREHGLLRNLATRLTKLALRAAIGKEIASDVGPFRAFRTQLRDAFDEFQGPYVSIDVLLSWGTSRFAAVPVRHEARTAGESSYGWSRLATHALNVLTGFSTRPLRIASILGLVFTLFGALVLVLVIVRYFVSGRVVPGFAFLASVIAIFSGAQLLTLGIIGEYLARMHVRVLDRPPYAIRRESAGS
jgi:undecaprenyl-phosphate 4-deoxy-4-formamido-L-arabinose transferase